MKKSIKGKALSILASTAMALSLCALPMGVHAEDESVINIDTVADLSDAISNQQSNQTWKIAAGTYKLTQNDLNKYDDIQPGTSGQGNWYFPIWQNNITIVGEGDVTITSDVHTDNGSWATQDFISVWGDNITIDNIDIFYKA